MHGNRIFTLVILLIITTTNFAEPPYFIGDNVKGGVVFWVDDSGNHGLVSAKKDQDNNQDISWSNGVNNKLINANRDGIYAGKSNTDLIVAQQTRDTKNSKFAALSCLNIRIQEDGITACNDPGVAGDVCYSDWYLPSKFELNQMFLQRRVINLGTGAELFKENGDFYWSSTEWGESFAWYQRFDTGYQYGTNKKGDFATMRFRCIRAF